MDAVTIFNNIIQQYDQAIQPMTLISMAFARETFTKLALITVAVALCNHLLRTQVDAADANVELFKTMLTLYFFLLLIQSYPEWLPLIGKTFKSVGIHLASEVGQVSGADFARNPGLIVSQGIGIGMKMLNLGFKISGWKNLGLTLVAVACSAVVIYCFVRIAIEVLLVDVGSRIILGVGVFMLGFAGSEWTKDYANKYISTMFNLGIKMLFIYVLVGIGCNITNHWIDDMVKGGQGAFLDNLVAIVTATGVYYMICLKVPDMAASLLSGHTAPGFGSGDANVRSIVTGSKIAAVGAVGAVLGGIGGAKAVSAAWKAASDQSGIGAGSRSPISKAGQGLGTAAGAVRTLGSAMGERMKEKFTEAVRNTSGGRLAHKIDHKSDNSQKGRT
jgi:type IV secretion system protein TrbL